MPDEPHLAGQAEAARHRAAHLRRDAEGHGWRIRDEHRFDPAPIAQLEDELPRPVGRQLVAHDYGPPDRESGLQLTPKLLRQVRHLIEVGDPTSMDPAIELSGVEGVGAAFLEKA